MSEHGFWSQSGKRACSLSEKFEDWEVITLKDWALIRRLYSGERLPKAQIARQLGNSMKTVAKAIASTDRPSYARAAVLAASLQREVRD